MSKKTPAQRRITYVKELRESLESAEDTDELIGTAKRAIEQLTIAYNLINAYEEVLAKNNLLSKMIISLPLPSDHWLYADHENIPPMPLQVGLSEERDQLASAITEAARYAVRASTMNGQEKDFDPDAMVQNMIVGLIGYWTSTGESRL